MNLNFTDNEKQLNKSFIFAMTEKKYAARGFRKYRILFFAYFFGTICSSNLFHIFPEDVVTDYESTKILYSNTLNYFYKQNYLSKENANYYSITKTGINQLYNHFGEFYSFDKDFFYSSYKCIRNHTSHAANTGLILLSFINSGFNNFSVSKPIDSLGFTTYQSENSVVPDAIAVNEQNNRIIFIEADASTEKSSSGLSTKFLNYVNLFDNCNYSSLILYFAIWNNKNEVNYYQKLNSTIHSISDLYHMFQELSESSLFFENFLIALYNSGDKYNYLSNLFLNKIIYIPDVHLANNIATYLEYFLFINLFTSSFYSRKNYLKSIITKTPSFKRKLYNGLSLIISPIHSCYLLNNFIYFDAYFFNIFLIKFYNNFKTNSFDFYEVKNYTIHGYSFCFRNIYTINYNSKIYSFIFENVSEDIGGYLRCQRYISHYSVCSSDRIILVCVYNELEEPDFKKDFLFHHPTASSVMFLKYSELYQLFFSRDEK